MDNFLIQLFENVNCNSKQFLIIRHSFVYIISQNYNKT